MTKISAGILPYRLDRHDQLEVFLVHPGGPFWAKKDDGSWSIAKGEAEEGEIDLLAVAKREFLEETGFMIMNQLLYLEPVKQPSRKIIHAWAVQQDIDPDAIRSNEFEMEWPRGSGSVRTFPEIDRAGWFNIPTAKNKCLKGQLPIIEQLVTVLSYDSSRDRVFDNSGQSSLF